MEEEKIILVNEKNLSWVTKDLENRINELKDSIKELDHFFSSSNYICPHCNHDSLQIIQSAVTPAAPEDQRFEFTCNKCGFTELIL